MTDPIRMDGVFRFDEAGTLPRPGPIGRLVRIAFGAACLYLVWQVAPVSDPRAALNPTVLFWAGFGLLLLPYVVNIGFGVNWRGWTRIATIVVLGGAALTAYLVDGAITSSIAWQPLRVFMIYVYAHLGISFLLSGVIATPGCEMRSIPHLLGIVRGRGAAEHYCPGFIGTVDRWESQLTSRADNE